MSNAADNTAIALAIAEHLLTAAAKAVTVINTARAENRAVTDFELSELASADDIERARLDEAIRVRAAADLPAA